jgi:phosphatidylserine/phosphatidylglycerophosphate/cardiolipin synthase-like enzyme
VRNEGYPLHVQADPLSPIIRPGQNVWRVAKADRLGVLVDGEAYFRALEAVLEQARNEVWIIGWDFNPDIPVRPDEPQSPMLGAFLLRLVEQRPDLIIRVLIWAMGPIASGAGPLIRVSGLLSIAAIRSVALTTRSLSWSTTASPLSAAST